MSAHKLQLVIKPDAQDDLSAIQLFSLINWGTEQRNLYRAHLRRVMRALCEHADMGLPRDELFPGCRSFVVDRHVIFYRVQGDQLVIGRVLHGNQQPSGRVKP